MGVNHLSKQYGGRTVLSDVSVEFPAQRVTSLIGPNGAGKSTLLMLMARLLEPSSGAIQWQERDVSRIPVAEYARHVATLRQAPGFNMRLTVEELVAFGRFPHSRGALTVQDRRAMDEAIAFLSLESLRHAFIDEISGGQRQMAFLAMTIAQQTDVLLLVIHDINFAVNYSDHIVALKNGALRFCGPAQDVVTETRMADLYELDFEITRNQRGCFCNYFTSREDHS